MIKSFDERQQNIHKYHYSLSTHEELEIQQRLAKRVFDNTIEGIFVTDADSRILQVNRAFTEITGYLSEEVLGLTPKILQSKHHNPSFYESLWLTVTRTGSWQGEIWNRRKNGSAYLQWLSINALKNSRGDVEYYVAIFHDLSELRAREAEIEYLVNHDPLTGLGNRSKFIDRIKQKLSVERCEDQKLAVIKLDLGEIQLINDSLGYAFSDRMIQQAAKRLQQALVDQGLLVRLGADEFGILIADLEQVFDVSQILNDCKSCLQVPFELDSEHIYMNPSLGVALYPDDADNLDRLLRYSDHALKQAKADGRNTFCFYNQKMGDQAKDRLLLEQSLKEAILDNGLTLNFQPKVILKTGKVYSSEVLVRWHHPTLGPISPAEFIPIAERCGLINELGSWVMKETCYQLMMMRRAGIRLLPVAINLSVHELERPGFAQHLMSYVNHYALEPDLFEFEVTETGLISREEAVIKSLQKLRQAGFKVALDDFGTGYSSLSYVRKLPLSTLKIDKSFVKDMMEDKVSASIVETVITLANRIDVEVVAEGIESFEQQILLMQLGCKKGQGYYFYKPLKPDAFSDLLMPTG